MMENEPNIQHLRWKRSLFVHLVVSTIGLIMLLLNTFIARKIHKQCVNFQMFHRCFSAEARKRTMIRWRRKMDRSKGVTLYLISSILKSFSCSKVGLPTQGCREDGLGGGGRGSRCTRAWVSKEPHPEQNYT